MTPWSSDIQISWKHAGGKKNEMIFSAMFKDLMNYPNQSKLDI